VRHLASLSSMDSHHLLNNSAMNRKLLLCLNRAQGVPMLRRIGTPSQTRNQREIGLTNYTALSLAAFLPANRPWIKYEPILPDPRSAPKRPPVTSPVALSSTNRNPELAQPLGQNGREQSGHFQIRRNTKELCFDGYVTGYLNSHPKGLLTTL